MRRRGGNLALLGCALLAVCVGVLAQVGTSPEQDRAAWTMLIVIGAALGVPGLVVASPWWQHRRAEAAEREAKARARQTEWLTHFDPARRGVRGVEQDGEFFTGRHRALDTLTSWVSDPTAGPVLLVVGHPGSGKSAVLSQLAALTVPADRTRVPSWLRRSDTRQLMLGVHLFLDLRGKTTDAVVGRIAEAAGVPASSIDELMLRLCSRRRPLVVVLDSLNESADTEALALGLVGRLADSASAALRLIVGTRGNLLRLIRPTTDMVIDLDDSRYFAADDLVEYTRRLLESLQPADQPPDKARIATVARAIAARAGTTFLVARLTAQTLGSDVDGADLAGEHWQDRFPDSVGKAMDAYLERLPGADLTRTLLFPLAFAEDPGLLPDALWARLASALGTRVVTDQDVRRLVAGDPALALLRMSDAHGASYRLFHEALAEHLRATCPHHRPEQAIVAELLASVPAGPEGWRLAHPYVREHAAAHAARAKALDELLRDSRFLAAAPAQRLFQVLSAVTTTQGEQAADVYRQVAPLLRDHPSMAVSQLELYARQLGYDVLADAWVADAPPRSWAVPWTRCRHTQPHRVLGRHAVEVSALRAFERDGRLLALSGDVAGTVTVWDVVDGLPLAEPLPLAPAAVTVFARVGEIDPGLVLAGTDAGLFAVSYGDGWSPRQVTRLHRAPVTSLVLQ